jgi:hypothetical protein
MHACSVWRVCMFVHIFVRFRRTSCTCRRAKKRPPHRIFPTHSIQSVDRATTPSYYTIDPIDTQADGHSDSTQLFGTAMPSSRRVPLPAPDAEEQQRPPSAGMGPRRNSSGRSRRSSHGDHAHLDPSHGSAAGAAAVVAVDEAAEEGQPPSQVSDSVRKERILIIIRIDPTHAHLQSAPPTPTACHTQAPLQDHASEPELRINSRGPVTLVAPDAHHDPNSARSLYTDHGRFPTPRTPPRRYNRRCVCATR